jgi:hypothetical protein
LTLCPCGRGWVKSTTFDSTEEEDATIFGQLAGDALASGGVCGSFDFVESEMGEYADERVVVVASSAAIVRMVFFMIRICFVLCLFARERKIGIESYVDYVLVLSKGPFLICRGGADQT